MEPSATPPDTLILHLPFAGEHGERHENLLSEIGRGLGSVCRLIVDPAAEAELVAVADVALACRAGTAAAAHHRVAQFDHLFHRDRSGTVVAGDPLETVLGQAPDRRLRRIVERPERGEVQAAIQAVEALATGQAVARELRETLDPPDDSSR